jgi:hypothetical protein
MQETGRGEEMSKKLAFLVLAFGLFVLALVPSAFAGGAACEIPLKGMAAGPGEIKFPAEGNPLLGPINNSCSAQQTCPSPFDGPIACTGNNVCHVFSYQISCDGNVIDCPCSIAPNGCNDPLMYCVCRSQGGTFNYCRVNFCV